MLNGLRREWFRRATEKSRTRDFAVRSCNPRIARWLGEQFVGASTMAKPPPSPPSSDIQGVDRDRVTLGPEDSDPELLRQLEREATETVGKPNTRE